MFQSESSLKIEENFEECKISVEIHELIIPQKERLIEVTRNFLERDKLTIDILFEEMDPVTYHSKDDPEYFIEEIKKFSALMVEDSYITLKILIEKHLDSDNTVSIYFFEKFIENLLKLSLKGSMYAFKRILGSNIFVKFNLLREHEHVVFGTNTFIFYSNSDNYVRENLNRQNILENRNAIGNFNNSSDNQFVPEDFYLNIKSNNEHFNNYFERLCIILSLVFISDFSSIHNDNDLHLKINGYKLIEDLISFKSIAVEDNKIFYDIYKWIYNGGNLSDKAGLVRNIVSLHAQENSILGLSKNIINSIKSSYEIYLKENVSQYIEVKNKVSEFLLDLAIRTNDLVHSFANALRNNHFLFLTFFVSVFVFNTLSTGKMNNIFNRDITYISYGLLLISFIYLIATIVQTKLETNRFKVQYERLKKMYNDLLNPEDISNIFKDDDHGEDIKFIEHKATLFSFVWLIEIVILYVVIYLLRV